MGSMATIGVGEAFGDSVQGAVALSVTLSGRQAIATNGVQVIVTNGVPEPAMLSLPAVSLVWRCRPQEEPRRSCG